MHGVTARNKTTSVWKCMELVREQNYLCVKMQGVTARNKTTCVWKCMELPREQNYLCVKMQVVTARTTCVWKCMELPRDQNYLCVKMHGVSTRNNNCCYQSAVSNCNLLFKYLFTHKLRLTLNYNMFNFDYFSFILRFTDGMFERKILFIARWNII